MKDCLDLPARILCIPLVHDIQERCEVIASRSVTVDVVVDCDKTNVSFRKEDVCVVADLKIVSSETAHILYDHGFYMTSIDFSKQFLKPRAFKVGPAITIVGKVPDVLKALLGAEVHQILFLIDDTVGVSLLLIIS